MWKSQHNLLNMQLKLTAGAKKKKKAVLCVSKGSEQGLQVLFLTLPRISSSAVGRSPNISADHLQNKDSNIFLSQQDVFRRVLGRHSLQ